MIAIGRGNLRLLAYVASVGIQRGSPIVLLPLFFAIMPVAEYGTFATGYAVAMVLAPVLSINGQAAILREGVSDERAGRYLLAVFALILTGLTVLSLSLLFAGASVAALPSDRVAFYASILGLGAIEGLFINTLAQLRATDSAFTYLAAVATRLMALVAGLLMVSGMLELRVSSLDVLMVHIAASAAVVLPLTALVLVRTSWRGLLPRNGDGALIRSSLGYCAPLLPHSSAQWLFNAIGRIAVLFWLGAEMAGYFNAAFTLGSIFSLAPAVFGLVVPRMLIADYERWRDGDISRRVYLALSVLAVPALVVLLALVLVDSRMHWTGIAYQPWSVVVIATMAAGYVTMTSYNLLGSVFFYLRDTRRLAVVTLLVAVVAVAFQFMAARAGVISAALAFAASQWVYAAVIAREAVRKDAGWAPRVRTLAGIFLASNVMMLAAGAVAYAWWPS